MIERMKILVLGNLSEIALQSIAAGLGILGLNFHMVALLQHFPFLFFLPLQVAFHFGYLVLNVVEFLMQFVVFAVVFILLRAFIDFWSIVEDLLELFGEFFLLRVAGLAFDLVFGRVFVSGEVLG